MRSLLLLCLAACGRLGFEPLSGDAGTDDADDASVLTTCTTFGAWSVPIEVPTLTSPTNDWEPALHPNGELLVFSREAVGLFVATRTGSVTFSAPTMIVGTDGRDHGPAWNPAGDRLYVASERTGTFRLWYSDYSNGTFGPLTMDGSLSMDAMAPALRFDELELYFSMDFPPVTMFRAERATRNDPWTVTGAETQLIAPGGEGGWPTLSADGLTLYFEGFNADGPKVYVSTRTSLTQRFGTPSLLTELNVSQQDDIGDPDVSRDGLTLMSSFQPQAMPTEFDIYISRRVCLD